ncbi:MAG: double-strand break repair helicase AddA [Alphaproteobacteria bacterium]|nr:double-strand break repair helicase AddA [Alphaproteobacteria bacterium]
MTDIKQQKQMRIDLASSQQKKASNPHQSVWVEASAGTGKTKVLSDRVLRLLLEGANPSRILCLTYTKAAASEMNNRIIDRLAKWAVMDEQKLIQELQNLPSNPKLVAQARRLFALLLDTPGGIKIQTIHSFCQEILKRFPLEAKVSPYFEVMDERETAETLNQIKLDILNNIPPSVAQALSYLTSSCSEYTFPKIMSSITDNCNMLENYFSSFDNFDAAIDNISHSLKLPKEISSSFVQEQFWNDLPHDELKTIIQALYAGTNNTKEIAIQLSNAINTKDFASYRAIFLTKDDTPKQKLLVKKSQELFPQSPQLFETECQRLQHCINKLHSINLRDSTVAVLTLAREILSRYQQHKFARAKMDYNDLISKTKSLLSSPQVAEWVLYKLDGGIDHILIDEAQDTSPEQWTIVQALSREFFAGLGNKPLSSIFVVGDRKQSIYSFQGADITEFSRIHDYFTQISPDFQTVNMEVSFRSTSAILDMVNSVFTKSAAAQGVVSTDQTIHHIPSRIGESGHVELWDVTYPISDKTGDDIWLPPVERINAQSASSLLAQRIAELIKHKVTSCELKADGTPLQYSDFLILIQRRNSFAEEMVRACKNADVAIAGIDKINLNEQIAILDLMAAAKFAVLPIDDLNLCCLLKSPIFGLDDDDLLILCAKRGKNSVWQQLLSNPKYQTTSLVLQKLYNFAPSTRPFEFFDYILNNLQGRRKFIARLGTECEDALDEFINLTLSFEQEAIPSLQNFVAWMQSDDIEVKRNLEQNDLNAVRLMTVHGSKGLQAPVVILPDTIRFKTIKQEAGWMQNGNLLVYPLGKEFYDDKCSELQAIAQTKTTEEYNRLLYVALTRAGEQLYICGYSNKNKPNENSWYELCKQSLSKLASPDNNGNIVYHHSSEIPVSKSSAPSMTSFSTTMPQWINQDAPLESNLARPLTPSHMEDMPQSVLSPLLQENNSRLYARGNLIHKLLQFLPSQNVSNRAEVARTYLSSQADDFSPSEQNKILNEVLNLVDSPRFSPLFGPNSLAEVALMGEVDGRIISGQIDRLVITTDKVMIVDYKTNRPAAKSLEQVPSGYLKQLHAYKKLAAQIYPDKKIETYILWTNTAQMMEIV